MVERANWSRLVVEAVVIVFSILLALAIAQAYKQWKENEDRVALLAAMQWDNSPSTWRDTGATTASLRTGGAYLISSDGIEIDDEKTALVTYWIGPEGSEVQDIYRCVDIVANVDFAHAAQKCWRVLRADDQP